MVKTFYMRDLTLPCNPGRKLTLKKLKSLSKKYFPIPKSFLSYYPKYIPPKEEEVENKDPNKNNKRKLHKQKGKGKKRRVGRPKKIPMPLTGIKSLTNYFRVK